MISFAVFDLDGTLAPLGRPCQEEEVALLHKLRSRGVRLAISSGKPTYYLCGFARQLGLEDACLVGENGGVLQDGIDLPPRHYEVAAIPEKTTLALQLLREKMEKNFHDRIWYQPNETALTPFPANREDLIPLMELIRDFVTPEMELSVYEHSDCIDVQYARLSKGEGIRLLSRYTGADPATMVAVGDWVNDYAMFDAVGHSVGIRLPDPQRATVNVSNLKAALLHILEMTN